MAHSFINDRTPESTHMATAGDFACYLDPASYDDSMGELLLCAGKSAPDAVTALEPAVAAEPEALALPAPKAPEEKPAGPVYSTWTEQVIDREAEARIKTQHAAANAAGFEVSRDSLFYAEGTRMAESGYAAQDSRKAEFERRALACDVIERGTEMVRAERRRDVVVSAAEIAQAVKINGDLTIAGFAVGEQALRGMISRIESPAVTMLLGLRNRVIETQAEDPRAAAEDRAKMAEILCYELTRPHCRDEQIKLRTREANGDIFAAVSPTYVPLDAPEKLAEIGRDLPPGARAEFHYQPNSTAWDFRVSTWTPTPVEIQAVGEAFEAGASFRSADNGTSRFRGGGWLQFLRCLNASIFEAQGATASRIHRGRADADVSKVIALAMAAARQMGEIWTTAAQTEIAMPADVTIGELIPGFWRSLLTDRESVLVPSRSGLTGSLKAHVSGLSAAYFSERRDPTRVTRGDLGHAWTAYIRPLPLDVRASAESAIGDWLASNRNPRYIPAKA